MKLEIKSKNKLSYKNFIQDTHLNIKLKGKLHKNYNKFTKKIFREINSTTNIFHSLSSNFKLNFNPKELKNFEKYNTFLVIGMGGSSLGSEAIYNFLKRKIKKKFIFLNNLDEDQLKNLKKIYNFKKIAFIIISKSGNTLETLTNIFFLRLIKQNKKNIIIISDQNRNSLSSLAKKHNLLFVEHKKYIGGRYSVFSEPGMLPAYFMGINFKANFQKNFSSKQKIFLKDSSTKLANILLSKKMGSIIFFNYIPQLNHFLFWLQQLISESLGKKGLGFLPVVSNAPKDHHSLMQLYLDGPKDKLFYIFSHDDKNSINISNKFFKLKKNISINKIKTAQKNAFVEILKEKKIPFREFKLTKLNEKVLSEMFLYFFLEVAFVGLLANINPFNQPAVEQVKIKTNKKLI